MSMRPRMLVIDDSETLLAEMSAMLRNGFDVTCTNSGAKACRLLQQAAFDLIIVDIFMPEPDGFEILGCLRKKPDAPRVLAMSGASMASLLAVQSKALGAAAFLTKPFSPAQLHAAVDAVLGAPRKPASSSFTPST